MSVKSITQHPVTYSTSVLFHSSRRTIEHRGGGQMVKKPSGHSSVDAADTRRRLACSGGQTSNGTSCELPAAPAKNTIADEPSQTSFASPRSCLLVKRRSRSWSSSGSRRCRLCRNWNLTMLSGCSDILQLRSTTQAERRIIGSTRLDSPSSF